MTTPDLTASHVTSYLASRGWERDDDWRGASVWRLETRARVLVPLRPEFEDDEALLDEAVRTIAELEERPLNDVVLDISEPATDTQYYRTYPDAPSGTTPLLAGRRAVLSIETLLQAAAETVETRPRLLISGRRSGLVERFLQRVMLGAAAPGSYILSTRVPITVLRPEGLDGTAEFSGRAVGRQLRGALVAARDGARQVIEDSHQGLSSPLAVFSDRMEAGVSANLCRALGDLGGTHRDRPFDVGFAWARAEPERADQEPVRFTGEMAAVLWSTGKLLEELVKNSQARITGVIKDLRRRPHGYQARVEGSLQVEGGELSDRNALWVALDDDQHQQAIQAYREQSAVVIQGQLSPEHGLELIVASFEVL